MFSKYLVSRCLLVAAAVTLLAASPCRALVLTAEVYETPGLDGYYTYDITATVQDGHINTFGFNPGEGIQGPLYQRESNPFVGSGIYTSALDDTGFLVGQHEGISVANQESGSFLEGAFTFGAEGWREHRSLELVRIVTDRPDEVRLRADLLVGPAYNDGTFGNRWHDNYRTSFDVVLSDIAVGPAPELGDLPAPPPPPVVPDPSPLPPPVVSEPPIVVEPEEPSLEVPLGPPPTTGRYDVVGVAPILQDISSASELTLIRNPLWIEHGDAPEWRLGGLAYARTLALHAASIDVSVANFEFTAASNYLLTDVSSDAVSATFQTPEPTALGMIALASGFLATRRRDREQARR